MADAWSRAMQSADVSHLPNRTEGRPSDAYANAILAHAVVQYDRLVGRPARRYDPQKETDYGPFVTFIRDLFEAMRVKASPTNAASRL